jgi:S-adenosyl-L-methionine hydrolase (adenosine-forming)
LLHHPICDGGTSEGIEPVLVPMRKKKPLVGVMTDFGLRDHYVGVMKAAMYAACPDLRIIDISHEVDPHKIREGAYLLWASYRHFPRGSVIVAVIDPGVGSSRNIIGARIGNGTLLGPHNGLLDLVLWEERVKEVTVIDIHKPLSRNLLPAAISTTFHGRDIFAPLAAHLASGKRLSAMGNTMKVDWTSSPFVDARCPETTPSVLHIDRFGNIVTNIRVDLPAVQSRNLTLRIRGRHITCWADNYQEIRIGRLCMIPGSSGLVEIVMKERSAAAFLGVKQYGVMQIQREARQ